MRHNATGYRGTCSIIIITQTGTTAPGPGHRLATTTRPAGRPAELELEKVTLRWLTDPRGGEGRGAERRSFVVSLSNHDQPSDSSSRVRVTGVTIA